MNHILSFVFLLFNSLYARCFKSPDLEPLSESSPDDNQLPACPVTFRHWVNLTSIVSRLSYHLNFGIIGLFERPPTPKGEYVRNPDLTKDYIPNIPKPLNNNLRYSPSGVGGRLEQAKTTSHKNHLKLYFNTCFLIILGLFSNFTVEAQKYSNEFLTIGIGARARAMGNATIASTHSVFAGYWNPAALGSMDIDGVQAGAMHTEQFAGVAKFDYLGAVLPLNQRHRKIGVSLIRFGIDDIPNTLSLFEEDGTINYDNVVPFSAADYALLLSYGQRISTKKGNLFVGGNAKIVYRQIGSFATSWGFGLDAAALYTTQKWKFGLVVRDASTTFNAWSFSLSDQERSVLSVTGNDLPINSVEQTKPQITLGIARPFPLNEKWELLAEMNWIATTDGKRNTLIAADPISLDLAVGLEFGFKELLYLRAGVNQFQKDDNLFTQDFLTVQPNIGIGLHIAPFRVDYAFTDVGEQRNQTYSHVLSLIMDFKNKKEQTR